MMRKRDAALVLVLMVLAGCSTKAEKLQNDQSVQLKGGAPVALVLDPQPRRHDMTIEITADQPIDVALVLALPPEEAVAQAKKDLNKGIYNQANAKAHRIECTISDNVAAVLVMWQSQGTGPATVQVKRIK